MAVLLQMLAGVAGRDTTPPTITSSSSTTVAENAALSFALTADESVTWSIVGGSDSAQFQLSGSTLQWSSNGTRDYEGPADSNTDNAYIVTVRATDPSSNTTDQTITVTVTDVSESVWTPASDTDLFQWFKGSDLSGSNGSTVTTWPDASGNSPARDATSGSVTLDTTGLNSLNVVNAAGGSSQKMTLPNIYTGLTAGSMYAVLKCAADPAASSQTSGGFHRLGSADPVSGGNHYPFTDGVVYDGFGSTVRKTTGNPTAALDSWHIVSIHTRAGGYDLYLNGTIHFTTATNTVGWSTSPNLFFGQNTSYFTGKASEIFITSASSDTTTRQKHEGYLAHRFAITSVLDSGHPYKTVAP
jgi:hypothetical protein